MKDIVSSDAPEDIYISPVGCYGIVRRKQERNTSINARLEQVLLKISSEMSPEEIEKRSRVQHRGRFSDVPIEETNGIDGKKEENLVASEKAQSALGNVVSTNTSPKKDYELGYQLTIFDIMDQVQ